MGAILFVVLVWVVVLFNMIHNCNYHGETNWLCQPPASDAPVGRGTLGDKSDE